MQAYFQDISSRFEANRNSTTAKAMSKYMRDQFLFFGIKSPQRTLLTKEIWKVHGLPEISEIPTLLGSCWSAEEREFQYFAIDMLKKMQRKLLPEHLALLEQFVLTKSWWDTVDLLASIIGKLFLKYPELHLLNTNCWIASDNIWLQRVTIIFQLHYKEKTDENLLFKYILKRSESNEFFVQKGMGWALRQHAKRNPESVKVFVRNNSLPTLTQREALKLLKV